MLDRRKYMDAREARFLLDVARGSSDREGRRNYVLLSLALNAGLRLREVVNLNLDSFTRDEAGSPVLDVWFSKRKASRRVAITEAMATLLVEWIGTQRRRLGRDSGPLFSVYRLKDEHRISRRSAEHIFKLLARRANLPECYSFHSLRHTFATYYYRKTRDLRGLQEHLGHRDAATTAIYAHVTAEDHAANMRMLPRELQPPGRFRRGTTTLPTFNGQGEEGRRARAPLP